MWAKFRHTEALLELFKQDQSCRKYMQPHTVLTVLNSRQLQAHARLETVPAGMELGAVLCMPAGLHSLLHMKGQVLTTSSHLTARRRSLLGPREAIGQKHLFPCPMSATENLSCLQAGEVRAGKQKGERSCGPGGQGMCRAGAQLRRCQHILLAPASCDVARRPAGPGRRAKAIIATSALGALPDAPYAGLPSRSLADGVTIVPSDLTPAKLRLPASVCVPCLPGPAATQHALLQAWPSQAVSAAGLWAPGSQARLQFCSWHWPCCGHCCCCCCCCRNGLLLTCAAAGDKAVLVQSVFSGE